MVFQRVWDGFEDAGVVEILILLVYRRFWKALPLPLGWQCALEAQGILHNFFLAGETLF